MTRFTAGHAALVLDKHNSCPVSLSVHTGMFERRSIDWSRSFYQLAPVFCAFDRKHISCIHKQHLSKMLTPDEGDRMINEYGPYVQMGTLAEQMATRYRMDPNLALEPHLLHYMEEVEVNIAADSFDHVGFMDKIRSRTGNDTGEDRRPSMQRIPACGCGRTSGAYRSSFTRRCVIAVPPSTLHQVSANELL